MHIRNHTQPGEQCYGCEFYAPGGAGSIQFEIAPAAILRAGLHLSELVGPGPVFTINARQINTGRFHPPLLQFTAAGTGLLQNSNNFPNDQVGELAFGAEYITDLQVAPSTFTLGFNIPEPSGAGLLIALAGLACLNRRTRWIPHASDPFTLHTG